MALGAGIRDWDIPSFRVIHGDGCLIAMEAGLTCRDLVGDGCQEPSTDSIPFRWSSTLRPVSAHLSHLRLRELIDVRPSPSDKSPKRGPACPCVEVRWVPDSGRWRADGPSAGRQWCMVRR